MEISSISLPMVAIVVGVLGYALPASVFGQSRRWAETHRELAGPILSCGVILAALSILSCLAMVLVLVGWLPPLEELIEIGGGQGSAAGEGN